MKYTIEEVFELYKKHSKERGYSNLAEAYFWHFVKWVKEKEGNVET